MKRRTVTAGLLILAVAMPALLYAEHTRFWRQSEFSDFEKGTPDGVAIRSDGKLTPAPKFSTFSDPNLAYLWALRMDSRGRVYAAGGSDAKVLRFDDPAKPTTVFESGELSAQTIAFDAHDNLFVGTSPDGKVYKVTPDGAKSTFFDPKAKYIWALAIDPQGNVFVGTGDKGEIFAVAPDGKGQLFYQSDERHARSLAFDSKGNLLVGTDPDGLILRIAIKSNGSAPPSAGESFVIYETNKKEVTSIVTDAAGNLYAASIGEKQHAPAGGMPANIFPPQPLAPIIQSQTAATALTPQAAPVIAQFPFFPSTTGGSEVVKIAADAPPLTVWSSRDDLVFSMGLSANGKVLLGTGNKGSIIELESDTLYSTIAKPPSSQVTSLISSPDGKVLAGTANPGKIFSLGPGDEASGSYESQTFDAKLYSHWGRLTWWGENGATSGKVSFYVRSGNTASPEKNWSPWAGPYANASGDNVSAPPARFVQWKAVFTDGTTKTGANAANPEVSWVSIAYQPENVAPVIDDIVVQDPNVRIQGFNALAATPGAAAPVQLKLPQRPNVTAFPLLTGVPDANGNKPLKAEIPPQGFEEKGYQSVVWLAHDENDDDLVFSVYYRPENDPTWRLLKDKLTQRYYSWDTTTLPDGPYYLKIVASDMPSNPPSMTLSTELTSDRFEVNNSAPEIQSLRAEGLSGGAKVTFQAVSSSTAIDHARYSVDAGEWFIVFPIGLLSDAPKESYSINVSGLAPGEHTVAVQVADRFDNTSVAKANFTVPSGAVK
jgi:WD40 repeat protein